MTTTSVLTSSWKVLNTYFLVHFYRPRVRREEMFSQVSVCSGSGVQVGMGYPLPGQDEVFPWLRSGWDTPPSRSGLDTPLAQMGYPLTGIGYPLAGIGYAWTDLLRFLLFLLYILFNYFYKSITKWNYFKKKVCVLIRRHLYNSWCHMTSFPIHFTLKQ